MTPSGGRMLRTYEKRWFESYVKYGKRRKPIMSPRIEARRKMARVMFAKPGKVSRGRVAMMKLLFRADAGR
jgi:hypothetical protein